MATLLSIRLESSHQILLCLVWWGAVGSGEVGLGVVWSGEDSQLYILRFGSVR